MSGTAGGGTATAAVPTRQQWLGGAWVDSASGRTTEVRNPANGQPIAHVQASGVEDVDRAATAAAEAFGSWQHSTPQDRSRLLLRLADAVEARADELGRLESRNAVYIAQRLAGAEAAATR